MAIAITIPRLGWNMEEGVFAGWLKRDGDSVREGEPLFSLEGDKATQDVESIDPGILTIPPTAPSVGDKVHVGATIGYLLEPGEAGPIDAPATTTGAATLPATATSGRARRRNGVRSTPLARRLARDLGVDWTRLAGSGRGGRVRKVDVLEAARADRPGGRGLAARFVPISPTRRTIAARMLESGRTTAPVTLTTTIDATNLVGLRSQYKRAGPGGPSVTDFFVKLTALALADHPLLNARWGGEHIELNDEVNVGIAVDAESGLFVPVIHGAGSLGLRQIAERSRDLVRRAREGRLPAGDMRGGTITITNLGSIGVEAFTPIINPPECAILGLGRIARQPVLVGDQVVPRERMVLSLTFDHRIVDGGPAARFLQHLGRIVEDPAPWLIA
jgi:pyruvate dehydrogenase E2 component (dihydrolipoamide acetyltransferase)